MIRLAIVDDDAALGKALKRELLEFADIASAVTYTSGALFLKGLQAVQLPQRPEVVLMDISMEEPDAGIHITRQVKNMFPDIKVIMLTISDVDELIFEAFRAGATGYLLKNEKPSFILKTILDVYGGEAQMSPAIARKTISLLTLPAEKSAGKDAHPDSKSLSERELEILALVEKGHTYDYIGKMLFVTTNTVKKHMMNIFSKLQVNNKIEAIRKAGGIF